MFGLMDRSLRAGRLATFVYFALNGFLMGMWVVHIPAAEHRAATLLPRAALVPYPGARHELFLERDNIRGDWLMEIDRFLRHVLA